MGVALGGVDKRVDRSYLLVFFRGEGVGGASRWRGVLRARREGLRCSPKLGYPTNFM